MKNIIILMCMVILLVSCKKSATVNDQKIIQDVCESKLFGDCVAPISLFRYKNPNSVTEVNSEMIGIVPEVVKEPSQKVVFSVSPSLPSGITLDESNGLIYGTPKVVSPKKEYVVTVEYSDPMIQQQFIKKGSGGSLSTKINIEIADAPIVLFEYPQEYYTFNVRDNVSIKINNIIGGNPTSFEIINNDPLPSGLFLNKFTGEIYGSVLESFAPYIFSIKGSNGISSYTRLLSLGVTGGVISGLKYYEQNPVYLAGEEFDTNYPIYSGEKATFSSLWDSIIPSGFFIFDKTSGKYSGSFFSVGEFLLHVIAKNPWSQDTTSLNISVTSFINKIISIKNATCIQKNGLTYCFGENSKFISGNPLNDFSCGINSSCNILREPKKNQGGESLLYLSNLVGSDEIICGTSKENKDLYCYGNSEYIPADVSSQELFNGIKITNVSNVRKLAASKKSVCGFSSDIELFFFGDLTISQGIELGKKNELYVIGIHDSVTCDVLDPDCVTNDVPSDATIKDVACSDSTICFVSSAGKLYCSGTNADGIVTDSTETTSPFTKIPKNVVGEEFLSIEKIASNGDTWVVVESNGSVYCKSKTIPYCSGQFFKKIQKTDGNDLIVSSNPEIGINDRSICISSGYTYCVGQNNNAVNFNGATGADVLKDKSNNNIMNISKIGIGNGNQFCYSKTDTSVNCSGDDNSFYNIFPSLDLFNQTTEYNINL